MAVPWSGDFILGTTDDFCSYRSISYSNGENYRWIVYGMPDWDSYSELLMGHVDGILLREL